MNETKIIFLFFLVLLFLNLCFSSSSPDAPKYDRERISGAVSSEDGKPLRDVSVMALDDSLIPIHITLTDENGQFSINKDLDKIYFLRFQKDGFLTHDEKDLSPYRKGGSLSIILIQASSLSGAIADGIHFSPLKDVSVKLFQTKGKMDTDILLFSHQETGESGEYIFKNIPPGRYLLKVEKETFLTISMDLLLKKGENKRNNIFLFQKGDLIGSIQDSEGTPIHHAIVEVSKELSPFFKDKGKMFLDEKPYRAETSKDGSFAIHEIPEYDGYRLSVLAEGFSPEMMTTDIHAGKNRIQVILHPGSSITGIIKNKDGLPLSHAVIQLQPHNEEYSKEWKKRFQKKYHPSSSGVFKVDHLPAGSYSLTIHSRDSIPYVIDIFNLRSGAIKDLGEIKMNPGLEISGSVENEDGEKLGSVTVTAILDGVAGKVFSKKTQSKKDGSFSLLGLKEGIYTVEAESKEAGQDLKKGIRAGSSNVLLSLQKGGTIKGAVLEEGGHPIEKFYIIVEPEGESLEREKRKYYTFTEEEGHYEIDHLKPGFYTLRAGSSGFTEEMKEDLEVLKGVEKEDIDFILRQGGTIEGYVLDKELRSPIPGASVSIYGRTACETLSDFNGYFLLDGIPLKEASLLIQHSDYAPLLIEKIGSARAGSYETLKIYLQHGGSIEGYVLEADDTPIYGALLSIKRKGIAIKAFSDLNGYYHLEHIPPGRQTLVKALHRIDIYSDYESKEVHVQDNERLRVDFKSTTEAFGYLMRRGCPIEGARISFIEAPERHEYAFSNLSSRSSYTDSTGFYRIRGLKEGRYCVAVENAEKRFIKIVNVPRVKEFHYDITYPEYEISGRVYDGGSLVPIAASKVTAIPSESEGFVTFRSQQYDEEGSPSTIMGATSEMQTVLTDASGLFTLLVHEVGSYSVSASHEGYVSQSASVMVAEGKTAVVEFPLRKSSSLKGRVRTSSGGVPIAGMVMLKWLHSSQVVSLEPNGQFALMNLEPRIYSLFIFAPHLAPLIIDQYEIEEGREYEEEFIMNQGGPLDILISSDARPSKIQIIDQQGRDFFLLFAIYLDEEITVEREEGRIIYHLPPLPAGSYRVLLSLKDQGQEKAIEIYDGVESSVSFEF